jgi:hypothetical protein
MQQQVKATQQRGPMAASSSPSGVEARGSLAMEGHRAEHVPRLVEALAGKKLINIGASVRGVHMAVWTDAGELFTFEQGNFGRLGHAGRGMCRGDQRLVRRWWEGSGKEGDWCNGS